MQSKISTDKKIVDYSQLSQIRDRATQQSHTVVLTTGCYDLLHLGHSIHLFNAKKQGQVLVVSVGNDQTLRSLKGPTRPIFNQVVRARLLAALEVVDYVVISEELGKMDHTRLVELLLPDVYVVPGDDSMLAKKQRMIEKYGAKIVLTSKENSGDARGMSTTQTEARLRGR